MAKIFIDPGHGGSDPGATAFGREESKDVLKLSLKIRDLLKAQGVTVVMARESEKDISINERCRIANEKGCDYYLSVHRNAGGGTGHEIWVHSQANADTQKKAQKILEAVVKVTGDKNRGLKKGAPSFTDFGVNRLTNMASALFEIGFIDTAADNISYDKHIEANAEAIAKALCEIVGVTYKSKTSPATRKNVVTYDAVTDKLRQTGEVKFDMLTGDENKILKAKITFKEPFKKTPRVFTSINSSGFNSDSGYCDVTKDGCTIIFKRSDVVDTSVNWLAIGE